MCHDHVTFPTETSLWFISRQMSCFQSMQLFYWQPSSDCCPTRRVYKWFRCSKWTHHCQAVKVLAVDHSMLSHIPSSCLSANLHYTFKKSTSALSISVHLFITLFRYPFFSESQLGGAERFSYFWRAWLIFQPQVWIGCPQPWTAKHRERTDLSLVSAK